MNWVDLVILVGLIGAAVWGASTGLLAQAVILVGIVCGLLAGTALAVWLAGFFDAPDTRAVVSLTALIVVLGACYVGGAAIGTHLRRQVKSGWARALDTGAGTAAAMVGVVLAAWLFAIPLAESPFTRLADGLRESMLMRIVRSSPPPPGVLASFRQALRETGFPVVFESLPETIGGTSSPPDPAVAQNPGVAAAGESTVKLLAEACGSGSEGSGWVYAPGRIATNAHVVAGSNRPIEVQTRDGDTFRGRVVAFDSESDIAVIAVSGLPLTPLAWTTETAVEDLSVAALGYPENGPFTVTPGRIRGELTARGRDIYDEQIIERSIYEVSTRIRPGNSGGPLVSPAGTVYGVVFAASSTNPDIGYALSGAEVADVLSSATTTTDSVDTGACL
ncbi:MAG: MarP family serine protease [Acidimicrobiia bacterium]|nr:MarP family serine protease [Acidimicrobiia bacterium]